MGIAAYNRGTKLISASFDKNSNDVIIRELNSITKKAGASTPFSTLHLTPSHNRWWVLCPVTGFGYHYPTIREALTSWNIYISQVGTVQNEITYICEPQK